MQRRSFIVGLTRAIPSFVCVALIPAASASPKSIAVNISATGSEEIRAIIDAAIKTSTEGSVDRALPSS
jgi:hypothetical protein